MTRSTEEWIGATDDTQVPPRVHVRLFIACGGACAICGVKITPAIGSETDHITALINGGENRESNLQIVCKPCHKLKTKQDVAIKAKSARIRAKHLGVKRSSRPLPGGKATAWKQKIGGGWVRRGEA